MSSSLLLILGLGVGLAIGGLVGWLLGTRRAAPAPSDKRVEDELRQQLTQREGELSQARDQVTRLSAAGATSEAQVEAAEQLLETLRQQLTQREGEVSQARDQVIRLSATGATSEAQAEATAQLLENLRQQLAQRQSELTQAQGQNTALNDARTVAEARVAAVEQLLADQKQLYDHALTEAKAAQAKALVDLREVFKSLSADTLKEAAPEFLRLAEQSFGKFQETAKGDLAQRQEAIRTLVEPLKQSLETYQQRLQQSETAQSTVLGEVREKLETLTQESQSLANETQEFRMVLHSSQARGRWGEETLRRVVEAAGMSTHCDFIEQAQTGGDRPDLIVYLPGDHSIIVDAKVPELDFLDTEEASRQGDHATSVAAHARKLKDTIKALADKNYPSRFPGAFDSVVLFLPAESLFSAALEGDRDLIVWAASRRITLATPISLIALLHAVGMSWQQHDQAENVEKIAEAAKELYARVIIFSEHFESIHAGLDKANRAFNEAVGSYEHRVRPSGERL